MDGETDLACAWVCGGVAYWRSRRPECWTARPLPRSRWLPQRPPPRAAPDPRRVALQEGRDLTVGEWARGEGGSGEGVLSLMESLTTGWGFQLLLAIICLKKTDQCWTLPPHYCSHWSGRPWQPSLGTHTRTPVHRNTAGSLTRWPNCFTKSGKFVLFQYSPACFTIQKTGSFYYVLPI